MSRDGSKVPPNDQLAEEALLGAMMLSKDALAVGMEQLTAAAFYKPAHAHIFEAICRLANAGEPVDAYTVAGQLDNIGLLDIAGGRSRLLELIANIPSTTSAGRYAASIEDCRVLREMIAAGNELMELGYTRRGDVRNALDEAEGRVFRLAEQRVTDTTVSFYDLMAPGIDELEHLYKHGDSVTGLPTGFDDLDDILGGLQPEALYILGARPSVGKTALALNIVVHALLNQKAPVYLFTLEMGHKEIWKRVISSEGRIDSKRMRNGQLEPRDWQHFAHVTGRLAEDRFLIDDNPNLTIMEMRAKARRAKARFGDLGLIVVDYLQLMTGRSSAETRQVEISEISRGLKILARELQCPVMALSQLSRGLELRNDKRPVLADLRESGSLEQDSDVVLFAYRDEIYNAESPDRGTAEIIVAKHRNGPTGMARLAFLGQYTRFANMASTSGRAA